MQEMVSIIADGVDDSPVVLVIDSDGQKIHFTPSGAFELGKQIMDASFRFLKGSLDDMC